jgi:hypothetical protein
LLGVGEGSIPRILKPMRRKLGAKEKPTIIEI